MCQRVSLARRELQRADVRRLQTLRALLDLELDALVLLQALEAGAGLDLAEVGEQVLAAAFGGDEAEALAVVELFDGAGLGGVFHGELLEGMGVVKSLRAADGGGAEHSTLEKHQPGEFRSGPAVAGIGAGGEA